MSELEARFRVKLEGKDELSDFFRKGDRDAKSFSSSLQNSLKSGAKEIAAFGLSTAKSLASLATGNLGIAANAKSVLELRDSINQLHVMSGKASPGVESLRQKIHSVATASGQMQESVTAALSAFVEKTGDIEGATKNLELFGKVATATGASLSDISFVGAELLQKFKIEDQSAAFGILAQQAKKGSIELKDLATKGPRIFAVGANIGETGTQGAANMGALAQIYARATGGKGTAATVATSIENTFAGLARKREMIEGAGIPFTEKGADGKIKDRSQIDVLFDIIRKTGGDMGALTRSKIFTAQGLRGVGAVARMYKETGGFGDYERLARLKPGNTINEDAATRMSTGLAKLNQAQISIAKSIDDHLGPTFEGLARHADKLAKVIEFIVKHPLVSSVGAATGVMVKNVIQGVVPKLLGGAAGQRVFVTNMPAGGPGGLGGKGGPGAALAVGAVALTAGLWAIDKWEEAGEERNSGRDKAGIAEHAHRLALKKQKAERDMRVKQLEAGGMTHGQAVYAADQVKVDKLAVNVNIAADGTATAEVGGTRSEEAMVRRGVSPVP